MFSKKLNVSAEGKYDATKVSIEGITAEELAKIAKENAKLIDIYTAFGADEKNGLSKLDLALAMDGFFNSDKDKDGKLSNEELDSVASDLNRIYKLTIDRKDVKAFLKSIRKYTKNDQKVATKDVIADDNKMAKSKYQMQVKVEAEAKAKAEAEAKAKAEAEAKAKAEAVAKAKAAVEEARIKDLQTPKTYTVQEGETLTGLLKKSLEAQGIEITDENLAEAKAEFAKNNPGALHGPKGKEYLYAGAEVKIAGNLEDKKNGKAINDSIIARNDAKAKAEAEAKAKAEAEAKAKAEAEAKAKAEAEAKAKAEQEAKAAKIAKNKADGLHQYPVLPNKDRPKYVKVYPMNARTFKNEFDKQLWQVDYINVIADRYGEQAAKEMIEYYDSQAKKNGGKTVKEQLILTGTTFISKERLKFLGLSKFE